MEDLVQDGLITLYMEANNVEEYLQSARETRSIRRRMPTPPDTSTLDRSPTEATPVRHSSSDEAVYSEEGEGTTPPETSPKANLPTPPARPSKPSSYQPCTIPQKRASVNQQVPSQRMSRLSRIYEEIPENQKRPSARKNKARGSARQTRSVSLTDRQEGREGHDTIRFTSHQEVPPVCIIYLLYKIVLILNPVSLPGNLTASSYGLVVSYRSPACRDQSIVAL